MGDNLLALRWNDFTNPLDVFLLLLDIPVRPASIAFVITPSTCHLVTFWLLGKYPRLKVCDVSTVASAKVTTTFKTFIFRDTGTVYS